MDRRVLLATSVLEREDELTPDHMLPKVVLEFHHPKSVWHVQEARGFGSLESGLRKHICRKDGSLREGADGNRHAKADEVKATSVMSRRWSNQNHPALDERRHSNDANRRRYGLGAPKDSRGAPPRRDLRSVRADIERHRRAQMNARPSLPAEWGAMGQVDENPLAGSGEDDFARSRTPLELAVQKSKENTPVASFLRGCLKFVGVLIATGATGAETGTATRPREFSEPEPIELGRAPRVAHAVQPRERHVSHRGEPGHGDGVLHPGPDGARRRPHPRRARRRGHRPPPEDLVRAPARPPQGENRRARVRTLLRDRSPGRGRHRNVQSPGFEKKAKRSETERRRARNGRRRERRPPRGREEEPREEYTKS